MTPGEETENLSDICHITKGFRFISSTNPQSLYTEFFYTLYILVFQINYVRHRSPLWSRGNVVVYQVAGPVSIPALMIPG